MKYNLSFGQDRTLKVVLIGILSFVLSSPITWAQSLCNGTASGPRLAASTAVIGGTLNLSWESPNQPNASTYLGVSSLLGPSMFPGLGTVCLDVFAPDFWIGFSGTLDTFGRASLVIPIPNHPGFALLPPVFVVALVADGSGAALSRTARIEFENRDSYKPTPGVMPEARALHEATSMARDEYSLERRVLITGGGPGGSIWAPSSRSSVFTFDPLTRTFSQVQSMSIARSMHQAVLLNDGRVLVIGGRTPGGIVTSLCEIFDPTTDTFSPTTSMNTPRAGHLATVLNDGRVLVTGGLAIHSGTGVNVQMALNTAQSTGEIYDPVTQNWTFVGNLMSSPRFSHTQTLLSDGNVLIVGGISGNANQTFGPQATNKCDIWNVATNLFTQTGNLPVLQGPRYGHAATLRPDGKVLVSGGYGNAILDFCATFSGSVWGTPGPLFYGQVFHRQVLLPNGRVFLCGGPFGGSTSIASVPYAGTHDGVFHYNSARIGTNPATPGVPEVPLNWHTLTDLHDGSFLIAGGSTFTLVGGTTLTVTTRSEAFIYVP